MKFCTSDLASALQIWLRLTKRALQLLLFYCEFSGVVSSGIHSRFSSVMVFNLGAGVQTSVRTCLPTKELFLIIPMHMMNRKIILGRQRGFDGVLYKL